MRRALIPAAIAGVVLAPLCSRMAEAICAGRVLPGWVSILPFVMIGLFLGFTLSRRRRGGTFVLMRGRVQCPDCAYLLDLDDRHCARCGTAIVQIKKRVQCTRCRARNWEDDAHCRQCGAPFEAAEGDKA